ncbi:ArnT family glycosyltransferase [Legionella sp. CNM-4043-24]|uniref:ArnT family glycosyltransferase n=1 Tax=Legionella sp. CNM-4043-24 TaxID=3421646 RepID=UPI00403AA263
MSDTAKQYVINGVRRSYLIAGLMFLLVCRLLTMGLIPLNDTTEARYAEIARKMLETGNWVTPLHDYGVPFWAKPPLSTWLSALSMKFFGVNELAVRLPSLLLSLGVLWLVWRVARSRASEVGLNAVLVLSTCAFFLLDAGTVMTDPALLFCISLSMVSFWLAVVEDQRLWGYLFFVGLGLGLLAKGPIALVLTGMPLFFWVLLRRQWRNLWVKLPWITGGLLMLAISIPWYVLAERRTPGFLNYFIVGEHIKRFLEPSWQGDKYGFAHVTRRGMIWVYALIAILPWTGNVLLSLIRYRRQLPVLCLDEHGWVSYLMLFALIPLLFFTFARNIIYPYVFPSLPAFALAFAELAQRLSLSSRVTRLFLTAASITGTLMLAALLLFAEEPQWVAKSQKPLVALWNTEEPAVNSLLIYWADRAPFSAQFYSRGRTKATLDQTELCRLLAVHPGSHVVLNAKMPIPFPSSIRAHMKLLASIPVLKETLLLFQTENVRC